MNEWISNISYQIKICLLGNYGVGKTQLTERITQNTFSSYFQSTIGVDFASIDKEILYKNNQFKIRLQMWDTAGQERFRSLITCYLRNVTFIFLVFDLSKQFDLQNISEWINLINKNKYYKLVLIGNKSDLAYIRKVFPDNIKSLKTNNIEYDYYFEVSAKTNSGIDHLFNTILYDFVNDMNSNVINTNQQNNYGIIDHNKVYINNITNKKTKNCCMIM